jgi:hypothetical protein
VGVPVWVERAIHLARGCSEEVTRPRPARGLTAGERTVVRDRVLAELRAREVNTIETNVIHATVAKPSRTRA